MISHEQGTGKSQTKGISELRMADLVAHPVWTWAENDQDESLVIPAAYDDTLPDDGNFFIRCSYQFHDDTQTEGMIGVNNHSAYLLAFPKPDGDFVSFSLRPQLKSLMTREQLANLLERKSEDIFPLKYFTIYKFRNGRHLLGEIT